MQKLYEDDVQCQQQRGRNKHQNKTTPKQNKTHQNKTNTNKTKQTPTKQTPKQNKTNLSSLNTTHTGHLLRLPVKCTAIKAKPMAQGTSTQDTTRDWMLNSVLAM